MLPRRWRASITSCWYVRILGTWDDSKTAFRLQKRYLESRYRPIRSYMWRDAFLRLVYQWSQRKHCEQEYRFFRLYLEDLSERWLHWSLKKHAQQRSESAIWHRWCPPPPMGFAKIERRLMRVKFKLKLNQFLNAAKCLGGDQHVIEEIVLFRPLRIFN